MKRYLDDRVQADLAQKMVFLTGPRQVGKTTLSRQLIAQQGGQYLNYDVPADRAIVLHQRWNPLAPLLVLDEIHKMPDWKAWLKGVVDGKPAAQQRPHGHLSAKRRVIGWALLWAATAPDICARMVRTNRGRARCGAHAFA